MSQEKEKMISTVRELIGGVDRERIWIMTIGLMGIIFSVVFATITIVFDVLRPAGVVEREALRPIVQLTELIFGVCSVISIIAGVKVLNFIRLWHRNYSSLKAAEEQLEKTYFNHNRSPSRSQ
jgi:hypothetical protein